MCMSYKRFPIAPVVCSCADGLDVGMICLPLVSLLKSMHDAGRARKLNHPTTTVSYAALIGCFVKFAPRITCLAPPLMPTLAVTLVAL